MLFTPLVFRAARASTRRPLESEDASLRFPPPTACLAATPRTSLLGPFLVSHFSTTLLSTASRFPQPQHTRDRLSLRRVFPFPFPCHPLSLLLRPPLLPRAWANHSTSMQVEEVMVEVVEDEGEEEDRFEDGEEGGEDQRLERVEQC